MCITKNGSENREPFFADHLKKRRIWGMSYFQDASPESLGISSGGILRFLDRMEEKGLIRRTADENDQRQKQVTATEKGRELNSLVQAAFQEAEAVMVKGLRLEETEALRLLLYRVIENLEEDRTTC